MKPFAILLFACNILLPSYRALAANAGSLDTSFDPGTGPNTIGTINAAVAQTDGKVIVAGYFTNFDGAAHPGVVRLNENGSVDAGFNHGSGVNLASGLPLVLTAAVQSDQKILVGGGFYTYDGGTNYGLVRLNTDGTVDSGFVQTNVQLIASSLTPLAGGKILVGLYGSPGLIRLNANGSIDTSFFLGYFGPSLNGAVNTIVVQPDGKLLVSGTFTKFYTGINDSVGSVRERIARLNADGTLDSTFNAGAAPIGGNGTINGIGLQSSGKIIAGGDFTNFNGTACGGVIRLTSTGAVDPTFTSEPGTTTVTAIGGVVLFRTPGPVFDLVVDPNDRVLLAGGFGSYNGAAVKTVIRLTLNGALDTTFDNNGPNTWTSTLFLQADGKMIISGYFTNVGGFARAGVARLNGTAAVVVAPTITSSPASVTATNPAPVTSGDLTEAGFRGKTLKMHILGGATPFPTAGNYDIVLAASGNTYSIPAGGAMVASSGNWTFGSDLGINTVLTLGNSFPSGGPVKVALLVDGTYEMYADGVVNNQNGTFARANADGTPIGPAVMFSVSATGTMPFTYTWLHEGSPITGAAGLLAAAAIQPNNVYGANTATLTISNAGAANAGKYSVRVANSAGTATSAAATLTVKDAGGPTDSQAPKLVVLSPPASVKSVESNHVNFAGTASDNIGLGSVSYSVNGGAFSGATGTASWTANVPLVPGTNVIRVRAVDSSGNATTNTRVILQVPALANRGIYNGLFFDPMAAAHPQAGAVTLSFVKNETFKGTLQMGTAKFPFAGTFGFNLTGNATVSRAGAAPLQLTLQLANGRLEGTVSEGMNWTVPLIAYRAGSVGALAGKYNLLLPGSTNAATAPGGNGFAALTLSAVGRLSGTATLGDGSPGKVLATVSPTGFAPLYLSLYGGAGSLIGWLTFADTTTNDVGGTLFWNKPGSVGGVRYPLGFTNKVAATGSRYVAPAAGTPLLGLTDGVVILSGGNLADSITNSATLGGDNKITGPNQLAITLSAPKGSFTGSFVDPTSSAKRAIKGVVLRKQNVAGGQFLGTDQSGGVHIGEQP